MTETNKDVAPEVPAEDAADKPAVPTAETPTAPAEPTPTDTTPETPAEDTPETPTEEVTYETIGDPNADAVVSLLRAQNVPIEEAHEIFDEAAKTGDMTKIRVDLLEQKVGKDNANLILAAAEKYYTSAVAATNAAVQAVYGVVGGKDNYTIVRDWARTASEKDPALASAVVQINAMFDLGKTAAELGAKELVRLYEAAGNTSLVIEKTDGDQAHSDNSEKLGRNEYVAQMKEAHRKNDVAEINRLRALRLASR